MEKLTFDELPTAVCQIGKRLEIIEQLLTQQSKPIQQTEQQDQLLTVQEAAYFLKLKIPTMYSKVSKGELPVMKRNKRLYFSRTELLEYIKDGRKKSSKEIDQEVKAYLSKTKKG